MARTSNGQYDRLITLRVVCDGDPQFWDWEHILFGVNPLNNEAVSIVKVEDA